MLRRAHVAWLTTLACAGLAAAALAPAAQAGFGPEVFEDGTCVNKTCTYASVEADRAEAFTQAAGHPPWGWYEVHHETQRQQRRRLVGKATARGRAARACRQSAGADAEVSGQNL